MRHRLTRAALLVPFVLVVAACQDAPTSAPGPPQLEIKDAVHSSGNPHFFFLPPMVPDPSAEFTDAPFDGALDVLVEICVWNTVHNACGAALELYNMETGPGSETVRVPENEEYYAVNWHTDGILDDPDLALGENEVYRIRVLVGAQELGHADVDVVGSGRELKNVDTEEFIPLVDGRTLPIKFRIEEGALTGEVVSAGYWVSCALATGGAAYCWGYNDYGQLGLGYTSSSEPTPQPVIGGHSFQSVAAGMFHSCGLTTDGAAYCWGYNLFGQLGLGHTSVTEPTPQPVIGNHTFQALAVDHFHTCGLAGETILCWGYNGNGELGRGHFSNGDPTPQPVTGGHAFQSVSAGLYRHTCGLSGDVAYCWGFNYWGQLGRGYASTGEHTPEPVIGGHTFVAVDAGFGVTCALTGAGAVYCWGYNWRGNLGRGYLSLAEYTPEPVIGGHVFQSVSTGFHSCGLTGGGDAWCWGYNPYGQLGLGYPSLCELSPQAVIGSHTFAYVSAGVLHTCGATTGGEVWCWGSNQRGEIGDGSYTDRSEPVFVLDVDAPTP